MVRAGRDSGVVALRPVSSRPPDGAPRRLVVYSQSFYGYYGMGWSGNVGVGISLSKDPASVFVELLVFNLEPERLVWAATSETKNPKNVQQVVGDLIEEVVKEMRDMNSSRRTPGKSDRTGVLCHNE